MFGTSAPVSAVGGQNVFTQAVGWVEATLVGPLATAVAVIAIAVVGLSMLSGRISVRRGATVILGCFVVFGASSIAHGLRNIAARDAAPARYSPPPPAPRETPLPEAPRSGVSDPYAGVVPRR